MTDKGKHIDKELLRRYLNGELRGEEAYNLERMILDRKFESEAMEGFGGISETAFTSDMNSLQDRLEKRTAKEIRKRNPYPARIAAAVIVLAVSGYFLFNLINELPSTDATISSVEPTETVMDTSSNVTPAVLDSIALALDESVVELPDEEEEKKDLTSEPVISEQPVTSDLDEADLEITAEVVDDEVDPVVNETRTLALTEEIFEEQGLGKSVDIDTITQLQTLAKRETDQLETEDVQRKARSKSLSAAPALSSRQESILPTPFLVTGKISGAQENGPLPGVSVTVKGSNLGTVSDLDGNYSLSVNEGDVLTYSYIGFITKEIEVSEQSNQDVTLQADMTSLSEVVVTGYGYSEESREITEVGARIEGGYPAFRQYISDNLNYPQEAIDASISGRVIVLFTINTDGSLSNFKIKKGLGYGCDEEAIRLIKQGPKWLPGTSASQNLTEEMRVTIRFKQ